MRVLTLFGGWLLAANVSAVTAPFCDQATGPTETLANPIVFVTQMPIPADFATIGSVFANHLSSMRQAGRGGDLHILFPDGNLCNLTREGGFGNAGEQTTGAIAVRNPDVHFDGDRVIFSMVVGGPSRQFEFNDYFWQLYEVTGLALGQQVAMTRVAGQPDDANNIMPVYAPDGSIVFVSDRPHNGMPHLYPPLDEYESTPTPSGLWKLDPSDQSLILMQHSPSGSFDPLIDSFGRVLFTRWDHLQRDQQGDNPDAIALRQPFDMVSESASAAREATISEVFPEPRPRPELVAGTHFNGLRFNHFFPWMINLDGTEEETLNHIGRHELHTFFNQAFNDDPNLREFNPGSRTNQNDVFNVLQMAEDPTSAGRYVAVEAPEFGTHAAGQLFALVATPDTNPDDMVVEYLTHPDTENADDSPSADHSGHYRGPVVMTDGLIIATHTDTTGSAENLGSRAAPDPAYDFQIKPLVDAGNGFMRAGQSLTGGINRTISYFDPDVLVSYTGPMWEMGAVEVRARTTPAVMNEPDLAAPEQAVFDRAGVSVAEFRDYLRRNNLALMVARDVTSRDDVDVQQPYNLRVPDGVETLGSDGLVYDVSHLQYVQGDMIRGYDLTSGDGRRILPRFLHEQNVLDANPPGPANSPEGGVPVFPDGSVAAFVPVRRAMAWQLTAPDHEPVVRERVWITFQPGEIRVCDGCHGVNKINQAGAGPSVNEALALEALLGHFQTQLADVLIRSGFESGEGPL